jgi:hypothetical protein
MNKITVLFPGGFKPLTGAHLALAQRYAEDPQVDRVILLIGPKERDGITRQKTIEMFNLLNSNTKIEIRPTEFNSPITAAYEYLFALPQDATGRYAMAASTKGDDYVRAKDFVPNVDKYATIGDKKGRTIPNGIDATELNINVDPLTYNNGAPISATIVRQSLEQNDYDTFRLSYPQYEDSQVKNAWQILKGIQEAAIFSKDWWINKLKEEVDDTLTSSKWWIVGDSIAAGTAGRSGGVGVKKSDERGISQVGANPKVVLGFLKELGDKLKNQNICLSSGISNDTNGLDTVRTQLNYLKSLKCKVKLIGVSNDPPERLKKAFSGMNDKLEALASSYGFEFLGGFKPGSDGVHPASYAKFKSALTEAIMNPKEKARHNLKIKHLRSFLEKHRGESFVYDFDQFAKTVAGAKLVESIITENYITRDELKQIEPIIDSFFKKYGIDVDFQGKFTHFIERLNDPRNEGTIRLDDLENLFRDLSDEYGDKIVQQFQSGNPTAIESDYQFDVPLHMPFQLEFDQQLGQIKLIPRTIKAQRRHWMPNNPNDVIYKIESVMNEGTLLTEGGAAGHMAHPWDDHGLSFNDMKEIVSRALSGRLDIEQAVTEKTDGQNIFVTWKNGEIGFARGSGTIINPMTTSEIIADFHRKQQKAIAEKGTAAGEDYQRVVDAYQACAEDLTESFRAIPENTLNEIFKNGRVFANMEIIYPATKNVIAYDKAHLQFHNLVEYDEKGKVIETDLTGGAMMQKIIQDANAHMQKTFSFIPPQRIKLGRVYNFEDQQAAFFNEIDQLQKKYNLKDTDLISEYHKSWWRDVIKTKAQQLGYDITDELVDTLMYRWAFNDKSTNISILKKQITNPEFLAWVDAFDKKDFKQFKKQNLEPFESIFLRLGVLVLQNASNYLAANPDKTVQDIKTELAQLIKDLQAKGDSATIQKLEQELRRIQKLGGFDAIVPTEGVVFTFQGNTYKMTGAFAPVNQLLGVLKYAR